MWRRWQPDGGAVIPDDRTNSLIITATKNDYDKILELIKRVVDAPITEQVYHVLHEGRPLLDAMKQLMTRTQKSELWGLG